MQIETEGLVIREGSVGESDRLVTLLTKDEGVLRAFARRAKTVRSAQNSGTQLLCYSEFSIFKGREKYSINEARPKEIFFGLREDIGRLALAQYFCELSGLLAPEGSPAGEYLRLVLNSLHFLSKNLRPEPLLKAVTEMRMLAFSGYMPDLVCCAECACYEADVMWFLPDDGILLCGDCYRPDGRRAIPLGRGVLTGLRLCGIQQAVCVPASPGSPHPACRRLRGFPPLPHRPPPPHPQLLSHLSAVTGVPP